MNLIAEIDGKKYKCVPSSTCEGCAFENKCAIKQLDAPQFNDYAICADMDFKYVEVDE